MIRAGLVFIDRYPAFTQLYVAELWRTNRAWQSTLLVVRQEAVAVVEDVLREGVENGELSEEIDIPLTAAALVGMVLVAALDWQAFQPERSHRRCALGAVPAAARPGQRDADARLPESVRAHRSAGPTRLDPPEPRPTGASRAAGAPSPVTPVFPRGPRALRGAPPFRQGCRAVPPPRVGGTGAAPLPWSPLFRLRRWRPIRVPTHLAH